MEYYLGGYYIIYLKNDNEFLDSKVVWTVSNCINNLLASINSLTWVTSSENDKNVIKNIIGINDNQFNILQNWIDQKFNDKEFTFSGTFKNIEVAREFIEKFVIKKENIKLMSIFLSEEYVEDFIKDNCDSEQSEDEICSTVGLKIKEGNAGKLRGYDLLGYDMGGDFHSLHCHSLKNELIDKFKIRFNEYELISSYQDSVKVFDFFNNEQATVTPVRWDIWKIKEYELK